jgi:pyruvate/2-oxoglutarate dehydrogenase complex dihydrolipoamide acyltransferase (E2) component
MVAISASIAKERNTIHSITEIDITEPRRIISEHKEQTGESLSFTAYIVYCLAQAIAEFPAFNSFRKGRKIILLEDVSISILVEREVKGEKVPEPFGIQEAQKKSYLQIHNEIREAQKKKTDQLGSLSRMEWVRFIPGFLMRLFFRIASKNIRMQKRYGVISVTAVGMFSDHAVWFVPMGGPTVLLTVGGIKKIPNLVEEEYKTREHLCLTVSFDHDIIDGAPAARFMSKLGELIESGTGITESLENNGTVV